MFGVQQSPVALLLLLLLLRGSALAATGPDLEDFSQIVDGLPPGFMFGTASAAYQVEGAVKEGGRGPTIWDTFSHMDPPKVARGENGDVACDSYHRYEEDADLAKNAGFEGFRLSFAWSRIYPEGVGDEPNAEGVQHYHDVLDALLERGLEPMVTLYHWDLPLALEEQSGGWLNASIVPAFEAYADTCFKEFGGKVKKWITINEPWSFIHHGYSSGMHAPGRCSDRNICEKGDSLTEPYLAGHNVLNSHARAVSLYRTRYKREQGGMIGMTLNCDWTAPLDPDSNEDKAAALRAVEFQLGWWADPIYFGAYPESMRDRVGVRLPIFTAEERSLLVGSNDFFGLNHYTSWYITDIPDSDPPRSGTTPAKAKAAGIDLPATSPFDGWAQGMGVIQTKIDLKGRINGGVTESAWLTAVPEGFRVLLRYVSERYSRPIVMVTENGMDRDGEAHMPLEEALNDVARQEFYAGYIRSMVAAIVEDNVDVRSYFAWSILDNFEWSDGYVPRFGLTYVDYEGGQTRTPKDTSRWFARLAEARHAKDSWRIATNAPPSPAAPGASTGAEQHEHHTWMTLSLLLGAALVLVGFAAGKYCGHWKVRASGYEGV